MRRLPLRWFVLAVLITTMSTAFAAHRADRDVRIGLDGWAARSLARMLPIAEVGSLAFHVQEGAHGALKRTSGVEIDHSYIRLGVGGEEIPVDPFEFHR